MIVIDVKEIDEGVGRVLSSVLALQMNSPFYSAFLMEKMGSYFEIAVTLDRFERNSKHCFTEGLVGVFTTDFEYEKCQY